MSTERKPGSRGITQRFEGDRANQAPETGGQSGTRDKAGTKGSTKTVSPRASYKKRKPRK